ncbi:hypothetical protein ACFLS0_03580 [Candidatus Bipolaricaulota bacterium]
MFHSEIPRITARHGIADLRDALSDGTIRFFDQSRKCFSLSTEDLEQLAPTETVQTFREILLARGTLLSTATNLIDVLGSVSVCMLLHCRTLSRELHESWHRPADAA